MSTSLTTLLNLTINHHLLEQRFSLFKVVLGISDRKTNYAKTLANIDRSYEPLGLIKHSGSFWILKNKNDKLPQNLTDMSLHYTSFKSCDDLMIGRLLTRALGKLAANEAISGLGETYFYVEPDTFSKQTVHKCVKVEMFQSIRFDSPFIRLQGQVFSPKEIVFKPPYIIDAAPKFSFVNETGMLKRDKDGDLIPYSPGKGHFTTNAIDISGQKPISLRKTRTGALHQYINLMNTVYGDGFSIELKEITADWRQHYTNTTVSKVYSKIYDVINAAGGLNIINASLSNDGYERLKEFNWPVKVTFESADNYSNNKSLLVVLDDKETYLKAGLEDPKPKFYHNKMATQSVYNSTIAKAKTNKIEMLIDTWIKELAVKLECISGKFLIQSFNENYLFIQVEQKTSFDEPVYHTLNCNNGSFSYQAHDEYYFDEVGIELPEKQQYFEELCYVVDMDVSPPQVCTIVHEHIATVPDASVLFNILNSLEQASEEGMSRDYIEGYLASMPDDHNILTDYLRSMLAVLPMRNGFYHEDFKQAKIAYRSKEEKVFFDGYFQETGIMFKYSIKGQHNEYLESMTGHFYDKQHSAYYVGMAKGGFKFSRGQFNNIRYLEGPDDLKQKVVALTETYYVRNKIGTVLPFPFKNITECIEIK